ncbi:hypothetical protein RJT34_16846 [Clitoria ternatea]|uniref:Transmembrane protein n=1 Tax=Clitoria ternatea TaxID=43366 RepID=A0AAN9J867_CLITE
MRLWEGGLFGDGVGFRDDGGVGWGRWLWWVLVVGRGWGRWWVGAGWVVMGGWVGVGCLVSNSNKESKTNKAAPHSHSHTHLTFSIPFCCFSAFREKNMASTPLLIAF